MLKNRFSFFNTDFFQIRSEIGLFGEEILNKCMLRVCKQQYRFREVEFYFKSAVHADTFTHENEMQLDWGKWYVHRIGKTEKSNPKGGKYKGLDFTFGNGSAYGGMLIRGLENIESKQYIDGPSLVVDEILRVLAIDVKQLAFNNFVDISLQELRTSESKTIVSASRVGLPQGRIKSRLDMDFYFERYRFLSCPIQTSNEAFKIYLQNYDNLQLDEKVRQVFAEKAKKHLTYMTEDALQVDDYLRKKKFSVSDWCRFYQIYLSRKLNETKVQDKS